jgi:hypothetical protein
LPHPVRPLVLDDIQTEGQVETLDQHQDQPTVAGEGSVSECEHEEFEGDMKFTRLREGDGTQIDYTVDIRAKCKQCGRQVFWLGLPGGYSPVEPRVNVDSTEMRAPFAMIPGIMRSSDQASVTQRVEVEIVRAQRPNP